MRDLKSHVKATLLLAAVVVTADTNTTAIDLQGYDSAMLTFNVGASGDTLSGSKKIELEIEESDDGVTYTDVADADLTDVVTGTNTGCVAVIDDPAEDEVVVSVGYKGSKRYVRGVINVTGTHTNGTPISVTGLRGHPHVAPVS